MVIRNDVLSLAVLAVVAGAGVANAQDSRESKASYLTLKAPSVTMDDATTRAPLMNALDKVGVAKTLDKYGINLYGFVELGYTYSFDHHQGNPGRTGYPGRGFDAEIGNHIQLDQVDLAVEKVIDKKKFDVGGKIEATFGTDTHFYHSNGLDFYANGGDFTDSGSVGDTHPAYQADITQAYVDINAPIGNGLTFRLGKTVSLLGYEYINPTQNAFYSHSFAFNYAYNFTQTGALAMYTVNDQLSLTAGVIRGWEQTFKDNNTEWSYTAQAAFTPTKELSITLSGITGPENTFDNKHWRTVGDLVLAYTPNSSWTFGIGADYGYDGASDANGGSATWYTGAGYVGYNLNDYVTVNGRVEAFYDGDGSRTGFRTAGGQPLDTTLFEGTLGLTIKPFAKNEWLSGLKFRPEVRYDFSDDTNAFFGNKHGQVTVGGDVIYAF